MTYNHRQTRRTQRNQTAKRSRSLQLLCGMWDVDCPSDTKLKEHVNTWQPASAGWAPALWRIRDPHLQISVAWTAEGQQVSWLTPTSRIHLDSFLRTRGPTDVWFHLRPAGEHQGFSCPQTCGFHICWVDERGGRPPPPLSFSTPASPKHNFPLQGEEKQQFGCRSRRLR